MAMTLAGMAVTSGRLAMTLRGIAMTSRGLAMTKSVFALTNTCGHDFAWDCHDFKGKSQDYRLHNTKTISGFSHLMNNSIPFHIEQDSFVTM